MGEGPFYEDFRVGQKIQHKTGRTLTDTDNIWFTLLTNNANQIHFNKEYAEKFFSAPPFSGRIVVNSFLILSLVIGVSSSDTSRNGIMLTLSNCKMLTPTFAGDTISADTEVLSKRESKSHEDMGIVTVRTTGYKQGKVPVVEFERTFMTRKTGRKWS